MVKHLKVDSTHIISRFVKVNAKKKNNKFEDIVRMRIIKF